MDNYISKANTTIIKFSSRASIKLKDNFYTVEYGEERQIDEIQGLPTNLEKEKQLLIDDCNYVIDRQIEEIVQTFSHKN